jgi:murein L,D-transpeptidase YafK
LVKSSVRANLSITSALVAIGMAALALTLLPLKATATAGKRSLNGVVERYRPLVDAKLGAEFAKKGLSYPPPRVALLGLKHEKKLELWGGYGKDWHHVKTYRVQAASGGAGPKLQEGDRQVPEGFYRIIDFNPNSNYHLSLKLNYPNAFDRELARREGRSRLGGNIFIHGKAKSIGCIAVGDQAIEELFVLTERVGLANTEVIISPQDFRNRPFRPNPSHRPYWVPELYEAIQAALADFKSE